MKKIFFTPGPSQVYPTIQKHILNALKDDILSISHRSKEFEKIYQSASSGLKDLLKIPNNYQIFFISSGTEAMERIIQNCVHKHSHHFINGSFSERFFDTAKELGKEPTKTESTFGEGFDFKTNKIPKDTELICFTQNESSSGVSLPIKEIDKISKLNPNKLITLDIVSSVPYVNLNYRMLDVVFFSVQKGFGLPAGLGVLIVSPKAINKAKILIKKGVGIGSYHNFISLLRYAEKNQTPDTPSVLEIYLLGKVIEDMKTFGIDKIRKQTEQKAKLIYDFLDNHKSFSPFVRNKIFRSQTIITVNVGDKQKIIKNYLNELGFIVGSGYGQHKDTQIRISNLPAHSISDIKRLIAALKKY